MISQRNPHRDSGNAARWVMGALALAAVLVVAALATFRDAREPRTHPVVGVTALHDSAEGRVTGAVVPGLEVLLSDSAHLIAGRRLGLITNHTGRDRSGRTTAELLMGHTGTELVALFAMEHGLSGSIRGGAHIASRLDSATGLPIRSLYGRSYAPTPEMLADIDALVYDVQDVGARPYTFVWSLTLAAEVAAREGKRVIVLDRPNPVRADVFEGGLLRPEFRALVGRHPVPMRYGLTVGELANWLVATGRLSGDVHVVPMRGYRRDMWYDDTGLEWRNPSPNIRDVEGALLFGGIVLFEATNVSEGRGTPRPFRYVGAPWMSDAPEIAREMNERALPGVRFSATTQQVAAGEKHGGRRIPMVEIEITDRDSLRAVDTGAWLLRTIYRRHPTAFRWQAGTGIEQLTGSRDFRQAVARNDSAVARLLRVWSDEATAFADSSRQSWIYR
jgi:uncharacterized protein YbbC (DUF1343 family)